MKKALIILNSVTLLLLIYLLIANSYPQKIFSKVIPHFQQHQTQPYLENKNYLTQTGFYSAFHQKKNIVMLGNSFTYRMDWTELLERSDVANRGIGSDITLGYVNRINYVLNLDPKICFIEGGVNDLDFEIDDGSIVENLESVIDTLMAHNIKPVLMTVNYVALTYKQSDELNKKIKSLNVKIIALAVSKKIRFIDLNPMISDGYFLKSEYTIYDGIHFTIKSYLIWKTEIQKILERENI